MTPLHDRDAGGAPRLMVVVASTRPGRVGLPVAHWFESHVATHGGFELDLADLAAIALPFLDEPHNPRARRYEHAHTKAWSARVDAADAFVFVMPEYNHGYCAPLKNAIDFLFHEWSHKPLGFVSYGGVAAGARAVTQLEPVVLSVQLAPVAAYVAIPFVEQFVDDSGALCANAILDEAAVAMLEELMEAERALRPRRAAVVPTR